MNGRPTLNSAAGGATRRLGSGDVVVFALLVGTLFTLLSRYHYGLGNQVEYLPYVFRELDSSFAQNDFIVDAGREFGPRFFYAKLFGALGSVCPLPVVYLVLTCLVNSAVALVTYLFARDLFRGSDVAGLVACILVIAVESFSLGGAAFLCRPVLNAGDLARPLALLSLWAAIRQRPFVCAALAAVASLIHPLVGLEPGAIGLASAGLAVLLGLDREGGRSVRRMLVRLLWVGVAGAALVVFTVLVWVLPHETTLSTEEFMNILPRFRSPHHYLPSTWPADEHAAVLAFLAAFGISWRWWYRRSGTDRALAVRVLVPVVLVLVMCVGGYLFVEVWPSRVLATVQPFRMLFIVKWIGLVVVAGTVARLLTDAATFEQSFGAWLVLVGSGFVQPFVMLLAHVVELVRRWLTRRVSSLAVQCMLGLSLLIAARGLMHRSSLDESLMVLVLGVLAFWFLRSPARWFRVVVPVVLLAVLFSANRWQRIPLMSRYLDHRRPILTFSSATRVEDDVACFAREHTLQGTVFVAPPVAGRFRLMSRRALVVDFTAMPFQDWAMVEWRQRLRDCYGEVEKTGWGAATEMDAAYRRITDERLQFIAQIYGASYAVLYLDTETALPVIYEGRTFKLVEIEPPAE